MEPESDHDGQKNKHVDELMNEPSSSVARTIATMETAQLCIHPVHHHSFAPVHFLLSGSMRKCASCQHRLKPVVVFLPAVGGAASSNAQRQVVRCVACGAFAHRSCAMTSDEGLWTVKCPVNSKQLHSTSENDEGEKAEEEPELVMDTSPRAEEEGTIESYADGLEKETRTSKQQSRGAPPGALFRFLSGSSFLSRSANTHEQGAEEGSPGDAAKRSSGADGGTMDGEESITMIWTPEGPPQHWADENSLEQIIQASAVNDGEDDAGDGDEEDSSASPLQIASHPFASVSRALQENVIAHFVRRPAIIEQTMSEARCDAEERSENDDSETLKTPERELEKTETTESETSPNVADMQVLLEEVTPESPEKPRNALARMASGTLEAAKASHNGRKKLGYAYVAGSIAGGVAGLVMAGPAGAVIGAKCGQTAGLLGVILEGSMTVGVIVAGVAAGGFTAQQIQLNQEKRILTIGEDGIKQKLLLVRPNISIDPEWDEICAEARQTLPSSPRRPFGILPSSEAREADLAKRERYQRDSDIVQTDETEIATPDKVLLLVSRSLNDKQSLPGHVYISLIEKHRERSEERRKEAEAMSKDSAEADWEEAGTDEGATGDDSDRVAEATMDLMRARRRDTHAVIKHVTATLLEVRPGFAASPSITEMSATAVEGLVFGELYDSVFEEIIEETKAADEALMEKIKAFEAAHASSSKDDNDVPPFWGQDLVSQPAIDALLMLPEAHSAADKLRYCVRFLELISVHFSERGKKSALNADSLLKMVCEHIIVAKVPNINAEIVFLEDFARDDQLLRGKEGYSLVTLQASLHFLNTSTDFDKDIFEQDDGETS